MKIKPSEKIHRRYLLIGGASKAHIEKAILDYIGILGWAKAAPIFVNAKGLGSDKIVLAIARESLGDIRAGFEAGGLGLKIKRVSGTLRALGVKSKV